MANPTAAIRPNTTGPYPAGPEGMLAEPVEITGNTSAAATTVDYVMQFLNDPKFCSPGFILSNIVKSGPLTTVTIKLEHAIAGTDVETCEIFGFVG